MLHAPQLLCISCCSTSFLEEFERGSRKHSHDNGSRNAFLRAVLDASKAEVSTFIENPDWLLPSWRLRSPQEQRRRGHDDLLAP